MSKWRYKRSFGPVVIREEDGRYRPICTWCTFRVRVTCTHKRPVRNIPDTENTPEWCEMRESMLRDVAEMDAGR